MKRLLTAALLLMTFALLAQAQQKIFVPNCGGINDTAKLQALIDLIEDNTGTIRLPFKDATRCATNTITFPENITLDNSDGTGLWRNTGATVTVLGPIVNPIGKQLFYGPGSTNLTGNTHVGTAGQARLSTGDGGEMWGTVSGGGGGVTSFNGRIGTVLPADDDYAAEQLSNGVTGSGPVVLRNNPTITGLVASTINGLTVTSSTGTLSITNGKTFTVNNTLTIAGLADGLTFTIPGTGTAVLTSRVITEGAGLAGNVYDLSANRTLAMGTPSTVSVSSTNNATGTTHNHGVASSSNPGSAASLLATNSQGHLQLERLGLGIAPSQALEVAGNVFVNTATANLFLKDTGTGILAASTGVVSLQPNNCLRSTNFTSGLVGLNICANGNAEFDNVDVRGAIHAGLIVFNAQMATAGTLGVFKSAAKLRTDFTVPAGPTYGTTTVQIEVTDPDGIAHVSAQMFAVNDILRVKDGLTGDTWFRVASATDMDTHWRYTATIMAGSNNATYRAGLGVADYGQTGQGFIIQTADQTNAPYLQMATHTASFSTQDASGTLNVTPRLRVGNLNGSYGYATNVYGFGTGQYGTAGQSWLTVDPVNGVRIGNNTTVLTQVDTSGNASFVGNITAATGTIGGWTINSNRLSSSTTHIASNFDVPGGQVAWFGKSTTSGPFQGFVLRDASGRTISSAVGFNDGSGTVHPFLQVNDGTRARVIIGGLNYAWGAEGSTNSMGMKVWSSAGALLSEFSDVQNMIAGWNITSTRLSAGSSTTTVGLDTTSTGGDDIRFFAGNSTPTAAPFHVTEAGVLTATNAVITGNVTATSGSIGGWAIGATTLTAVSGSVVLDSANGIKTIVSTSFDPSKAFSVSDGTGTIMTMGGHFDATTVYGALKTNFTDTGKHSNLTITSDAPTASKTASLSLVTQSTTFGGTVLGLHSDSSGNWVSTSSSLIVGSGGPPATVLDVASDMMRITTPKTPASASAACTQGTIAWDASFVYVCVATNTWKRSAIATW